MKDFFGVLGLVFGVLAFFMLITGWVYNIISVFQTDLDAGITGQFVVQVIGIFIPFVGAICGWVL